MSICSVVYSTVLTIVLNQIKNSPFPLAINTMHKRTKRRGYKQRIIEIEQGSFTPVIFSTSGGMGKSAEIFYRRLASMIREEKTVVLISHSVDEMSTQFFIDLICHYVSERIQISLFNKIARLV